MVRMSETVVTPEGAEKDPAGSTEAPQDAQHEDAATPADTTVKAPEVVEVVTPASWGPAPVDPKVAISVGQLGLAQFYGTQSQEPSPAQPHVKRLEEWLRTNGAVGGSNRKGEGFYGPKTGDLVRAAYEKFLPDVDPSPLVGADLASALKANGAPITP